MKKAIYSFIYYKLLGWKSVEKVEIPDKCVLCAAPHTSNFDLFLGKLFYGATGRKSSFMMKSFWFFFPLGIFFRRAGGIPVYRNKKNSLVEQMVKNFDEVSYFNLAITPEGTRKATKHWKKGFYYIASHANVPIILIAIDYSTKTITVGKEFIPTGDYDKDIKEIKDFYKDYKGKYPERFAI